MKQQTYDLTGWVLFGVGCLLFVIQGIRTGEPLTLIASVLFLVGVLVILIPYCSTR